MSLEDNSKWPEKKVELSWKQPIAKIRKMTKNYVVHALNFYENLDFWNLSHDNYRDICTWFQTSWENVQLREFLWKKWIKIYGDYYGRKDAGYVIENSGELYIQGANYIAPVAEFQSENKFRYVRLLMISWEPRCITVIWNRYFYAHAVPLDSNGRLFFMRRLDETHDLLDKAYKKVFELWAWKCKISLDGETFRFYLNKEKTLYIDYNGFDFSPVTQVGKKYPYGTQVNTHTFQPPTH